METTVTDWVTSKRKRAGEDGPGSEYDNFPGPAHTIDHHALHDVISVLRVAALPDSSQIHTLKGSPAFLFLPDKDFFFKIGNVNQRTHVVLTLPNLNDYLRKRKLFEDLKKRKDFIDDITNYYSRYPLTMNEFDDKIRSFGVFAQEPDHVANVDFHARIRHMPFKLEGEQTSLPNFWGNVVEGDEVGFKVCYAMPPESANVSFTSDDGKPRKTSLSGPVIQVFPYAPPSKTPCHGSRKLYRDSSCRSQILDYFAEPERPETWVEKTITQKIYKTNLDGTFDYKTIINTQPYTYYSQHEPGMYIRLGIVTHVEGMIPTDAATQEATYDFTAMAKLSFQSRVNVLVMQQY